jgi:hypothetical protein
MAFLGINRSFKWLPTILLLLLFLLVLIYGIANGDIREIIRRGSIL